MYIHSDLVNSGSNTSGDGASPGLYLFDDADDGAVTYLRNCSWSRPAPAGYYAAIYDTGIEDVGPQA